MNFLSQVRSTLLFSAVKLSKFQLEAMISYRVRLELKLGSFDVENPEFNNETLK